MGWKIHLQIEDAPRFFAYLLVYTLHQGTGTDCWRSIVVLACRIRENISFKQDHFVYAPSTASLPMYV